MRVFTRLCGFLYAERFLKNLQQRTPPLAFQDKIQNDPAFKALWLLVIVNSSLYT